MARHRGDRGGDDDVPEEYGFDDDLVFDFEDEIDFGDSDRTEIVVTGSGAGPAGPGGPGDGDGDAGAPDEGENRFAVIGLIAVVIVVGLALSFAFPVPASREGAGSGEVQQVWMCPDTPGGGKAGSSSISVLNLSGETMAGTVSFVPADGEPAPEAANIEVAARSRFVFRVTEEFEGRSGGTVLTLPPGPAAVAQQIVRSAEEPKGAAAFPCAQSSSTEWWFASGSTKQGRDQALFLMNPSQDTAIVDLTFRTESGEEHPEKGSGITVAPGSVTVLDVDKDLVLRRDAVSTIVRTQRGRVVAAQRLSVQGAAGFAESLGTGEPGTSWFLTGGRNGGGQTESVSVLNATGDPSSYTVFLAPDQNQEPVPPLLDQPLDPGGRATVDLTDLLPENVNAGIAISGTAPGAVDQYRTFDNGRVLVQGAPQGRQRWALPVSGDDAGQDVLEILNTGNEEVTVEVFPVLQAGADELSRIGDAFVLPGASRASITVSDLSPPAGPMGLLVAADGPIVAARGYALAGDRVLAVGTPVP